MKSVNVKSLIKLYEDKTASSNSSNAGTLSGQERPLRNTAQKIETMSPIQRLDFDERTVLKEAKYNILLCEIRIFRREKFGNSHTDNADKDKFLNNKFNDLYDERSQTNRASLRAEIKSREMEIEQEVEKLINSSRKARIKFNESKK